MVELEKASPHVLGGTVTKGNASWLDPEATDRLPEGFRPVFISCGPVDGGGEGGSRWDEGRGDEVTVCWAKRGGRPKLLEGRNTRKKYLTAI